MIKIKDIFDNEYKYNLGSKLKLQEMHKEGTLKVAKSNKTFDKDLNTALQIDLDVCLVFLYACQNKFTLFEMSDCVYNLSPNLRDDLGLELRKKAYTIIEMSVNPINFTYALKGFLKEGLKKMLEEQQKKKKQTITQI